MNPLNRNLTAGGSSGGEGVIVAMRGSVVGWGTDVGGSIRIPAMCNGIYGFKPSNGRVPYGGQEGGGVSGFSRLGVQAVAGPLARSIADIDFVMREVLPRAAMFGEDCLPGSWLSETPMKDIDKDAKFVFGVIREDGNTEPHPPVLNVLNEVSLRLGRHPDIKVLEIATPAAWQKCQGLMSKLMGVGGSERMADLLQETGEPLVPWMKSRFIKTKPRTFQEAAELQSRRAELEKMMLDVWYHTGPDGTRSQKIDAIICPVAPHPIPEIERWNAVGYTSSFVLLDYPAASMPIRSVTKDDLDHGKEAPSKELGSWDKRNRELWSQKTVNRNVYLGTPLSIQVVTPKLRDCELVRSMDVIARALSTDSKQSRL